MSGRGRSITTPGMAAAMLLAVGAAGLGTTAHATDPQVPFHASYSGHAVFASDTTVSFDGTGIATHLGLSVDHGDATITGPNNSCAGGLANTHVETLTAANGDTLTITAHNVACPIGSLQFRGTGTWVVTGGTGRFHDVTGSGTFNGRADFATQEFSFVMSGTIAAPGA
jgi:hypothetical protein